MSERKREHNSPFSFWTLVCLVIANMIGVGVFTTSGFTIQGLGSPSAVLVAWTIAGFIALCGAYGYGQLIRVIPRSGGEYLFLSRTIGPFWGFLAGWVSLIAGFTGAIAIAATAFESYALPAAIRPDWLPGGALACATIALAGALHGWRVRAGAAVQNFIVVVKLILIVVLAAVATWRWNDDIWHGLESAVAVEASGKFWLDLATSIVWISFSYSGFNAAVYVAEEARSAAKNVPAALLTGTAAVFVIYLVLNAVFVYAPTHQQISGQTDIATIAARAIGGSVLENLVRVLISVALLTSITSMMMAAPRVYAKMAEDRLFPSSFRFQATAPRFATIAQALLAIAMVLLSTLRDLLNYLSVTLSVSAAATVACLLILRPSRLPRWGLWIAATYVAGSLILAILLAVNQPWNLMGMAITLLSGAAAYSFFRWRSRGSQAL